MSFDALMIVLAIIAVLSSVFFFLAILADIVWPLLESRPWRTRRQATYTRRA
jgi:hypothetical protein